MSTGLDPAPQREMVNPFTGELVARGDIPNAVKLARTIRDYKHTFDQIQRWVTDQYAEFCDERAEWTHHIAGMTVSIPPPTASDIDWDIDELHKLEALLPADRYGELVQQVVTEKPNTRALQNAKKAGGDIGAIIERAERRKPKSRYLKFS